jgi:hypothetical protein
MKFKILLEIDNMDSIALAISYLEDRIREGHQYINMSSCSEYNIVMRPVREDEKTFMLNANDLP